MNNARQLESSIEKDIPSRPSRRSHLSVAANRSKKRFAKIRSLRIDRPKNRKLLKTSYNWHRRVGLIISLPVLVVAITGIILNHAQRFGIDSIYLHNSYILSLYGMTPSTPIRSMQANGLSVSGLEGMLFIDGRLAAESVGSLRGADSNGDTLYVASESHLILFALPERVLIEKLDEASLPPGEILGLRVGESRLLLDTDLGRFSSDLDVSEFKEDDRTALPEAVLTDISSEIEGKILEDWRGRGVSLWRLLLDLHSGKLFGLPGTFVSDILALSMLLLVASGFYNSRKRRRS